MGQEKLKIPNWDEIPVAQRENQRVEPKRGGVLWLLVGGLVGLGAIAALAFYLFEMEGSPLTQSQPDPAEPSSEVAERQELAVENVLGHLPYQEASPDDLEPITRDGRIRLRRSAAQQYRAMEAAARADGVILSAISGFRTVEEQQYLFFGVKQQRNQGAAQRAEVSAPPGYSEHHTGYAVDIGDGRAPATNLSVNFENTAAFRWLEQNASRFSFELSFPQDNPQGIAYEPWHWRFVGDIESLETFYRAQNLRRE
ncbi:D-alanyl-D-alanine carboxypeptidase family protein [Spirulina subsalsa FACHB-351]|uniref:D-alanyl-D-alanine carboxypeptidase family protein n=1 Tax=Spirulina subsalsa FACHB-351 TaxID=234711 RepID=A0ABT3L9N1_9CYAN|nr:M15 family metallopeptidase [Spirulina subsalsa]MCW6038208.1 D-alanyl-D-alanine carboxypeptidase family protein [Spirulina subsalsa FACHB-351]